MMRGVLILAIVAAIVLVVMALLRRAARAREARADSAARAASAAPPKALPRAASTPTPPAAAHSAEGAETVELTAARALSPDLVLHKLNELAFARELSGPSPGNGDIASAAAEAMATAATEPKYAPRRPLLLPQLVRAVGNTNVSRRELATMIAKDPALVGSLLKLANSQFYRVNSQPVESVDRAVALIGHDGIRSLITAALIQPVFRVSGGEFSHFPEVVWEHTFLSATAAETYAAVVVNSDPFAAQLLALVYGLGSIVVFRVVLDQYALRPTRPPDAGTIVSLIETHGASVARSIAASWDLSGRILAALEDQIPGKEPQEATPLGRALRFGRFMGALGVLNARGLMSDEAAKATRLANGASGAHFERIWERLTGKPPQEPPKHRPAATLRP